MASDTTPLLPQSLREPEQPPQGDSHSITLRACHSPWRFINQKALFAIRTIITSYLTSATGVALKYKLDSEDDHGAGRIPFQFSTVALVLQWLYHLITLAWTGMHTFDQNSSESDDESQHSGLRHFLCRFVSPSHRLSQAQRYGFSMFYTVSHVYSLLNGLMYWAVLVPAGHGGFKTPNFPHHHHGTGNRTGIFYDPSMPAPSLGAVHFDVEDEELSWAALILGVDKGLFEQDGIKTFSIINIWTITAIIAFLEMVFFNSIRRQSPVVGHVLGTMVGGGMYLAWAGIGKLATDHWGLFFLDPKLMGDSTGAAVAAAAGFVLACPVVFTYIHGLIAMRESMTASR